MKQFVFRGRAFYAYEVRIDAESEAEARDEVQERLDGAGLLANDDELSLGTYDVTDVKEYR